jgi:hypothetical protein
MAACAAPPPSAAVSAPKHAAATKATPGGDLFGAAAKVLFATNAAKAAPPRPSRPSPAAHQASAQQPGCVRWGDDVYGNPVCIAYSRD